MIASKLNDLSYRSDSGEVRNAFKEREISWNVVEKTLVSNKILLPRQVPRKEITVQQKGRKKIATDKIMQDSSSSNASKVPISPDKPKNEFDVACGVVRAGLEVKLHVLSGIRNTTPKLQDEYEKAEAKYSKLSEEEKKEEKLRLIRVQELLITTIDVFSDYRAEGQSILNKINGSPKQSKNLGPIPQDMANGSTFQDSLK